MSDKTSDKRLLMSEIKYKGIDLQKIKDVQVKLEPYKIETITFDKEKLLMNLEKDETIMEKVLRTIKRYEMQKLEASEMYCICEMARLYLEHCKDMQEILNRLEEYGSIWVQYQEIMTKDEIAESVLKQAKEQCIRIVKEVGGMNVL